MDARERPPGESAEPGVESELIFPTDIKKAPDGAFFYLAESEGFEPSIPFGIHTFQACSFNRSDNSPDSIIISGILAPDCYLVLGP